jgi:hypothetical protein
MSLVDKGPNEQQQKYVFLLQTLVVSASKDTGIFGIC